MRKTNTQREKPSCSVLVFPHIFGGVGGWGDSIYRARKKHLSLSLGIQHQGFLLLYSIPSISYLIFFFFFGIWGKKEKRENIDSVEFSRALRCRRQMLTKHSWGVLALITNKFWGVG